MISLLNFYLEILQQVTPLAATYDTLRWFFKTEPQVKNIPRHEGENSFQAEKAEKWKEFGWDAGSAYWFGGIADRVVHGWLMKKSRGI